MSEKEQADTLVAKDFVYCGVRMSNKDLWIVIIQLNPDGTLGKEAAYDYKKSRDRTIGGIYRGASFSENQCRGLDNVSFVDSYKDTNAVIGWKALNDQAKSHDRINKLEKDAKKTNEIDEILLPLRKLFHSYRKRNDYAGMDALEAAFIRSLRTPIRQAEEK